MTQTATLTREPPQQAQPRYVITADDKARQQAIRAAWKAYDGDLDKPLTKMEGEADDNVLSNRMKAIVQRGVDFLFGKELEISVEEGAPKEAQDFLNTVWARKEARIPLLQKLAMNGALAGQAFLRIVPGPQQTYRLQVVDPSIVCVETAPQDVETVLLYCLQYSTTKEQNGRDVKVFYREEISRIDPQNNDDNAEDAEALGMDTGVTWQIQHWTQIAANLADPHNTGWTPAGPPISWPYPFPPLFSCQNLPLPNSFWGEPDITPDLVGVNEALNLTQSDINRTLKLYGNPFLYATGVGDGKIDRKVGQITVLPTPDSKIASVTLTSDVAAAIAFAADLRSDIDEQSSVPGVATGRISTMPRGSLSGIAIELLFMPILKKTEKKQCTYGELIIDVCKALFVLHGMSGDIDMTLAWSSPLPHDDLAAVQAAIAKKELGMTNTTALRSIGEDPEEEAALSTSKIELMLSGQDVSSMPPALPGVKPLPGQLPAPQPGVSVQPLPTQGGKP